MGREKFLKHLKEFDDTYVSDGMMKVIEYSIQPNQTPKEFLSSQPKPTLQYYSQIDYEAIRSITNLPNEDNPFSEFYNLDELGLRLFFKALHNTNLFLKYYEKFELDRLRSYSSRQALKEKYKAVLEDIKTIGADELTIKTLENRIKGLETPLTITERKIFENLLFWVTFALKGKLKHPKQPTNKIAKLTNQIIDLYYGKTYKFSRKMNLKNFKTYHYTMETAGTIPLTHSKHTG